MARDNWDRCIFRHHWTTRWHIRTEGMYMHTMLGKLLVLVICPCYFALESCFYLWFLNQSCFWSSRSFPPFFGILDSFLVGIRDTSTSDITEQLDGISGMYMNVLHARRDPAVGAGFSGITIRWHTSTSRAIPHRIFWNTGSTRMPS